MKPQIDLSNHWIPVGLGDFWIAQCLGTREFVAVGQRHTKPLVFPTVAAALIACDNAQRGIYDKAPDGGVWRVVSNGITTRKQRLDARASLEKPEPLGLGELLRVRIAGSEPRRVSAFPADTYGY